uniref:Selenoprotein O n=1 Tax=Esox lucius TaxID=8010 RepID=A0A3P8ZCX0_ESOLU
IHCVVNVRMDSGISASCTLEYLPFNNVVLKKLPLDTSEEPGSRTVSGACFSQVQPQPLINPTFVAVSGSALALLGLNAEEVLHDPLGPEYLSGSKVLPGAEPAAHCYSGHQFGVFAGQLGDGAVCYLGEVEAPGGQLGSLLHDNPCGRWEIQVKGAGVTPYSRESDGRKVLRSSIREFLCSEAMAGLGIPTTRAASLVTSDLCVSRDPLNQGQRRPERCSVVLRIAPSFIRFGSFEIFHSRDEFSGRRGPSPGRHDIRAQLLDYVIDTFYPDIQRNHGDCKDRNTAFFKEVTVRTARLVALWQSVGFCHGVLNTDNMSILGLTVDYGPFGFMDRYDPEYVCNASDRRGRYSYRAQPSVCHWNLARLAEALGSELHASEAAAILDEFMPLYKTFYLANMRRKLGLVMRKEPEDHELVSELLRLMHNTGADFTNTFRMLSGLSCPVEGEEAVVVSLVVDRILQQCASLEELKVANMPTMEPCDLAMVFSMAQTNPAMFSLVADQPEVAHQLEKMGWLKELLSTNQDELRAKQREDWLRWVSQYRKRLARECDGASDLGTIQQERVHIMDRTNPRVVLRNYIAQNAILAAENGDFSEVRRLLKVLENPYSTQTEWELSGEPKTFGEKAHERVEKDPEMRTKEGWRDENQTYIPYDSMPPAWACKICVT